MIETVTWFINLVDRVTAIEQRLENIEKLLSYMSLPIEEDVTE